MDGARAFAAVRYTEATLDEIPAARRSSFKPIFFFLRLPFNLAVADGTIYGMRRSLALNEPAWAELVVRKVEVTLEQATHTPYESGLAVVRGQVSHLVSKHGSSLQTWVVATTGNYVFEGEDLSLAKSGAIMSIAFERCLAALNRAISAEQLIVGNSFVRPIAKEALDPKVSYSTIDPTSGLEDTGLFTIHRQPHNPVPNSVDPIIADKVRSAIGNRLRSDAAKRPHPFVLAREMRLVTESTINQGDPFGPIQLLQTSAELLLRGLIRMILVDFGMQDAEIVARAEKPPFARVLKSEIASKVLGGDWNSPTSAIAVYRRDIYDVRISMSHAGRAPSWQQLNPAARAYSGLVRFIEQRTLARWRVVPRTLLAIAEPWAGGSLVVPPAATNEVRLLLDESEPYWLPVDLAGRPGGKQATGTQVE